jgi:chromate transporter
MGHDVSMAGQEGAVGRTFLRLGLTSFGGPTAHLGYFRTEFVARRRWLGEAQYADLVALGQFLPGPASSQVGMGVGLLRAGIPGALRAWVGFTAPTAVLLIAAGVAVSGGLPLPGGLLAGLEAAAVAVVAQAVLLMARSLCRGWRLAGFALATGLAVLAVPTAWMAPLALLVVGGLGVLVIRHPDAPAGSPGEELRVPRMPRWAPAVALGAFVALLALLPLAARAWPGEWLDLVAGFYRAGALVFGGGHVVLPLLQEVVVEPGYVTEEAFLAGYGLANAMPGPLFAFAGYLGAVAGGPWLGLVAVVAIFLPAFLLVVAVLGHWHHVRGNATLRRALAAINAAVVGLLAAALYDPVIRTGITGWGTAAIAAVAFVVLLRGLLAPHVVVLASAAVGWLVL